MSLIGKIYILYTSKIFPRIKNIRGATRLKILLGTLVLQKLEKIDEKPQPVKFEDWNNLIILDACRSDLYEEVVGVSSYRISAASHSSGFIRENFSGHEDRFKDTVVITANPFYEPRLFEEITGNCLEDVFHDAFLTFSSSRKYGTDDWDDLENTVLPEDICKNVELAHRLYPDKRKIIHFMQPHHPFLDLDLKVEGWDAKKVYDRNDKVRDYEWKMVERGDLDPDVAIKGYRRNLELVMPYVHDLASSLDGKTFVTADHGNLVGEAGLYGHQEDWEVTPLRKVPWHELSRE